MSQGLCPALLVLYPCFLKKARAKTLFFLIRVVSLAPKANSVQLQAGSSSKFTANTLAQKPIKSAHKEAGAAYRLLLMPAAEQYSAMV